MPELKREKTGETVHSKKELKEKIKKENPDMEEEEVEDKVVKESFRTIS